MNLLRVDLFKGKAAKSHRLSRRTTHVTLRADRPTPVGFGIDGADVQVLYALPVPFIGTARVLVGELGTAPPI